MNAKKTLIAIALTALLVPAAFAGPYGGPGPNVDYMAERLDLTAEQKAQVEKIYAEQREKREAMRGQVHEQIRAVLTDEQKAQFDQFRANRLNPDRLRYKDGAGPRHGW